MRIALLTLPSVMSDAAVTRFAAGQDVVLLGLSDPRRAAAGGAIGQLRRHLARSGPRILPYLALGFGLPGRALRAVRAPRLVLGDVNGSAARAALRAARPDLIVTLHFDQILAPETVALARLGGINLHPSLLPLHRGPVPAFWTLAEGTAAGVSVHRLVPRIDAGEVLAQREVALPPGISALAAARLLHLAGVETLRDVAARLGDGPARGVLPEPLPYCGFPDAAALRGAARRGVKLVRAADIMLIWQGNGGASKTPSG